MRRISLTTRPDCLTVRVGRDHLGLVLWGAVTAAVVAAVALLDHQHAPGFTTLLLSFAALPLLAVRLVRLGRTSERTLVRTSGRLLLDGEPLEMARVELRVVKMPVTRVPTGYALSLWVMGAAGPEDVPIGHSRTLLEASTLSGQLEDFVQRANLKQSARLT